MRVYIYTPIGVCMRVCDYDMCADVCADMCA